MNIYRIEQPFCLVIFGASGDLAKLKIFPSLFSLNEQRRFPKDFSLIGYSRTKKTDDEFRAEFVESVKSSVKEWDSRKEELLGELIEHVHYFTGMYDRIEDFNKLRRFENYSRYISNTIIAYFSVPPTLFRTIIKNLGSSRENKDEDIRLILEKPFGVDESSARDLFHFVSKHFLEDQIYLLDHYLGKKAVRSLIPLRLYNRVLDAVLKGSQVDNIQITALEAVGIEKRVGYFNQVGIIKDMIQSHLLQILALTLMQIPVNSNPRHLHNEKSAFLNSLEFDDGPGSVVIGQYSTYKENTKLYDSETPTFASLRLRIDRHYWYGVPVYFRTGKKLGTKETYIVVELKKFEFQPESHAPNRFIIELFPKERVHFRLLDEDGSTARLGEVQASESIACVGDYCLTEHGLLLLDVIRGNKTHFLSFSEILASWKLIDRILKYIEESDTKIQLYEEGTCGPDTDMPMGDSGRQWFDLYGCIEKAKITRPVEPLFVNQTKEVGTFWENCVSHVSSIASNIENGKLRLAMSGGSSVQLLRELRKQGFNMSKLIIYQVDERFVLRDDKNSNYRAIKEELGDDDIEIVGIPILESPEESAAEYQGALSMDREGYLFDLIVLGVGPDGHTASLFPNSRALQELNKLVTVSETEEFAVRKRVTLTFSAIERSRYKLVLLVGSSKQAVFERMAVSNETYSEVFPAKRITQMKGVRIDFLNSQ